MKGIRRIRQRLCALPLALACLMGLAACGGPDFGSFSKELTFGDKQISDTQTTYVMKIPEGKLGDLIGPSQIQWVIDQYGDPPAHTGAVAVGTKKAAKDLLRKSPELQCRALENTYQEESSDEGKWEYKDSSCRKQRKLSWLEKTLWNMYQVQSDSTIEWLSTSRNTLVAANDTVSTLQANATPNYDSWFAPVNRYLRIAQGVLVAAAAISLIVLSARIVWNIGQGGEGRLLDRIGWILLGVLLGSSCASIALTFFSRSSGGNPDLPSWTPGGGTTFFLSDYIRMQVDPFLIIAAVCGVIAAGWKLVTQQEGRDLIPLGKAFMWAILSAVCLAGLLSGLGRNGGKPQGANGGGKHAKPLEGNPTGGEPQNTGDQPQGANRKGSDGKPQGANGNGAGSPVPPAPDGASPDPSGGNRPQGANGDAGGFAREGAPDGADRSTTRKGKTF